MSFVLCRLEKADSDVLNYLLEFVNWSTLSPSLKIILDQRRAEKTWEPHTYFGAKFVLELVFYFSSTSLIVAGSFLSTF